MAYLAAPLARLVEQLERLPSVGHKSAQRLAFHILNMPDKSAEALGCLHSGGARQIPRM